MRQPSSLPRIYSESLMEGIFGKARANNYGRKHIFSSSIFANSMHFVLAIMNFYNNYISKP